MIRSAGVTRAMRRYSGKGYVSFGRRLVVSAALGLFCVVGVCQEIYKWKDAAGTVHYSEKAPPDGVKNTRMTLSGHVDDNSSELPPSSPLPTTAEAKAALDLASKKQEEHLCTVAKQNLELLNSDAMIASDSDLDSATQLLDEQRATKRSEAQAQIARYCHEH
ncbi:DUF4124 domain-containing protein [Rhodanobacter fulvus]|uniref:DUF4124 domain-containing protein n=1 Tax=Rhodanobacter fulvus TaxID=219571 RepID=UPI0012EA3EC3|nr:DUF4124 domain-containing protein [Rhodanobacter fulvus]